MVLNDLAAFFPLFGAVFGPHLPLLLFFLASCGCGGVCLDLSAISRDQEAVECASRWYVRNYVRMVFVSLCVRVIVSVYAALQLLLLVPLLMHYDHDDGDDDDDDDDDDGDDEDDDDDHDDPGYC